jgi:hypothetical protein
MRINCSAIIAGAAGVLLLPALAVAQSDAPLSPWKYYPEEVRANEGPGGPAPVRDITGTWVGESSGGGVKRLIRPESPPPYTPLGQQLADRNIVEGGDVSVSETNDPHYRYCDPFGFPRNMNDQIRSMTITTLPDRTFVLLKFMNIWREIWTDGRELPATFRGRGPDVHDPTYNGYSVGHWEDDYTFVVQTTGMDPSTWATEWGHPHSVDAVVTERFHRSSKNDLTVTTTMVDPRLYTREVDMGEVYFRWSPRQTFFDFSCVPSTVQRYLEEMADPAGGGDPEP